MALTAAGEAAGRGAAATVACEVGVTIAEEAVADRIGEADEEADVVGTAESIMDKNIFHCAVTEGLETGG
jgi:hypothetical protein